MRFLYRFSCSHPILAAMPALALAIAAVPGLLCLELRTDGRELAPRGSAEVRFDADVRREFGLTDPLIVLVRADGPSGIYNPAALRLVHELSRDLAAIEGLSNASITSLDTEPSDRHRPGTIDFARLLEPLPATQEECERLRSDVEAIGIYSGTIVSTDGRAAAIYVGIPAGADRAALLGVIEARVAGRAGPGERIDVIGAPVAEVLLGLHILEDLGVPRILLRRQPSADPAGTPGEPWSLHALRRWVGNHVGLVPIALAVMAGGFLTFFRRPAAALLPFIEVGACLVFTLGLMGWLGVPIYLTVTVMPVILAVTGVTDEVHVLSCYQRIIRGDGGGRGDPVRGTDAVLQTMDEMFLPVLKTTLTTAIGFLAFVASPLPAVRVFGLFTGVGVLYCLFFSMTAVPAALVLVPPRWFASNRASAAGAAGPGAWLARLGFWVARHRVKVLAVTAVATAVAAMGLVRIRVEDSWIDGFDRQSGFSQASRYFNERFLGMHVLVLHVDTGHDAHRGELAARHLELHDLYLPADLVQDPATLVGRQIKISLPASARPQSPQAPRFWDSWIERAEVVGDRLRLSTPVVTGSAKFLLVPADDENVIYEIAARRLDVPRILRLTEDLEGLVLTHKEEAVGGVLGPADYLKTTRFIQSRRAPDSRQIPDDPRELANLWHNYGVIRGERRVREVVDEGHDRALITVYLKNASYAATRRLMDAIRAQEGVRLAPEGIRLGFAGDVAVSQALIDGIVKTQVRSVLFSLAGIFVVTGLVGRSLRWGLYCVVPCGLAVLMVFAAMGWLDVPLGVATSMFASMALGIGVDYAIHLTEYHRAGIARGLDPPAALADSLSKAGPAIVADGLAVAAGFSVLFLSQVPANARLAGTLVLSLLVTLAGTIFVLGALITPGRGRPQGQPE